MGRSLEAAGSAARAGGAPRPKAGQEAEPSHGREPVDPRPVAMGDRRWRRGLARRPDDPHASVLGLHEQRIVLALCEGLSREEVERRLDAQMSNDERRRLADRVIDNDGDLLALRAQVEAAWTSLRG